jgi:hypothetical protein
LRVPDLLAGLAMFGVDLALRFLQILGVFVVIRTRVIAVLLQFAEFFARTAFLSALRCAFWACFDIGCAADAASALWAKESGVAPTMIPSDASSVIDAIRTRDMTAVSQ